MQNNPRPLFVKCLKCGCGNPPSLKACRNCHAPTGRRTFNAPPAVPVKENSFRKYWLLILILPLLYGVKYYISYGQVTIKKSAVAAEEISVADPNIVMPPGAWYEGSLKSWIWKMPSTEDVLTKEIQASGGWKALKPLKSVQIRGKYYSYGCETEPKIQNIQSSTDIILKFKAPNKYLRERIDSLVGNDQRTEVTIADETGTYQTYYTNNFKPKNFSRLTDSGMNFNADFFTVAQNYAANYYDFSDVSISQLPNKRVAYVITAMKENSFMGSGSAKSGFSFDVVTGRLVAMNGITFLDYQKVGNVYLPFKICTYDDRNGSGMQVLVESWLLDTPIPDSDFDMRSDGSTASY